MNSIRKHLSEVSEGMTLLDLDEVKQAVTMFTVIKRLGGTAYIFGNGGSHSTASHFANDLMKIGRVKAVCVGDMGPTVFAYGNDDGWGQMFRNPLSEMMTENDIAVGISCSGNSENVLNALGYAVEKKFLALGMTGMSQSSAINKLGVDHVIHAPFDDIRVQEDLHMMICHAIARSLQAGE